MLSFIKQVAARKSREKRISGIEHLRATKERKEKQLRETIKERKNYEIWNPNLRRAIEILRKSLLLFLLIESRSIKKKFLDSQIIFH